MTGDRPLLQVATGSNQATSNGRHIKIKHQKPVIRLPSDDRSHRVRQLGAGPAAVIRDDAAWLAAQPLELRDACARGTIAVHDQLAACGRPGPAHTAGDPDPILFHYGLKSLIFDAYSLLKSLEPWKLANCINFGFTRELAQTEQYWILTLMPELDAKDELLARERREVAVEQVLIDKRQ